MTDTPELDKMMKAKPDSQIIGEFLDWLLSTEGIYLCKGGLDFFREPAFYPDHRSMQQWLAKYFDIDLEKCEQERRMVLEKFTKQDA